MGFSYLDGKNWLNVTREERLFCAHLYHDLRVGRHEREFVRWLGQAKSRWERPMPQTLGVDQEWEVAYEVCFYRDLLKSRPGKSARAMDYPSKRTFDLCLFSEQCITVVEAKVHEGFDSVQIGGMTTHWDEQEKQKVDGDKQKIRSLVGGDRGPDVLTVALASSIYLENRRDPGGSHDVLQSPRIDAIISWKSVHDWAKAHVAGYADVYSAADSKYRS
ncbi:MAG: hypothetical protein JXA58_05230 [Dehalococcoidia bacterium]|nr:hypothetical protein [Dehalococcoidia bacterium]